MNDNMITVQFGLVDSNGYKYKAKSTFNVFTECGDSVLYEIGEMFNTFLKQCGYVRQRDFLYMEDVSEEEIEAIDDFLRDYRRGGTDAE